jgi:lauroyl/myristoyl acyltransferase
VRADTFPTVTMQDVEPAATQIPDLTVPRPVPWGGAVAHLRASEAAHRLVPLPVANAALDLGQRLAVSRDPARLDAARAAMAAVVGGTEREADLEHLAFRHLCAAGRGWELMWRPRALLALPVEGLHHLPQVEPGRGIVFSTPHYGPLVGLAALPCAVGTIDGAVGEHLAAATVPAGYHGHQIEQSRRVLVQAGFRVVRAAASARTFTRTLTDGGRVLLNFDVPGTFPVQFLGKTVELMTGTARLAAKTDSVVVPVLPRPRGRGWYVHLDEPIDPRRHDSWQSVLQATADVHSRLILAAPEHLESPLRDGGWAAATRDGWRRAH